MTKKGINFNIVLMKISLWSKGNNQYNYDLLDLGPSVSQSSDGDASAASRILVISFLQVCLFWATDLKCSLQDLSDLLVLVCRLTHVLGLY